MDEDKNEQVWVILHQLPDLPGLPPEMQPHGRWSMAVGSILSATVHTFDSEAEAEKKAVSLLDEGVAMGLDVPIPMRVVQVDKEMAEYVSATASAVGCMVFVQAAEHFGGGHNH